MPVNKALPLAKADWQIIDGAIDAVSDGATTARQVSEQVGKHYTTIYRHLKTVGLPPISDLAKMEPKVVAQRRKEARDLYDRLMAAEAKRKAEEAKQKRREGIPTGEELRKAYRKRKEAGSRAVICKECGARGTANTKIVGKRGPVLCGQCRTRLGLW